MERGLRPPLPSPVVTLLVFSTLSSLTLPMSWSKLNADRQPGESFGGAMSRIYSKIGFAGLWNGLPVRIVMIGTLTGLQWMIYDSFKIFMGLPTTGGGDDKKTAKT